MFKMRKIAPHLQLAESVKISNIWLLEDSMNRRFLVDTGFYTDRPLLKLLLWRSGIRRKGDLTAVLLTHRHSDHAGNAAWLKETFECPVICHPNDVPTLHGLCPPTSLLYGDEPFYEKALCVIEDHFYPTCQIDECFEEGQWKWGFHVIPTPGHTEGSVMLYHEPTKTLFSGDSILSGIPPLRAIEYLSLAHNGFSLDVELCHESVRTYLKALPETDILSSGHGPVVTKGTSEKLKRLLEN